MRLVLVLVCASIALASSTPVEQEKDVNHVTAEMFSNRPVREKASVEADAAEPEGSATAGSPRRAIPWTDFDKFPAFLAGPSKELTDAYRLHCITQYDPDSQLSTKAFAYFASLVDVSVLKQALEMVPKDSECYLQLQKRLPRDSS